MAEEIDVYTGEFAPHLAALEQERLRRAHHARAAHRRRDRAVHDHDDHRPGRG